MVKKIVKYVIILAILFLIAFFLSKWLFNIIVTNQDHDPCIITSFDYNSSNEE